MFIYLEPPKKLVTNETWSRVWSIKRQEINLSDGKLSGLFHGVPEPRPPRPQCFPKISWRPTETPSKKPPKPSWAPRTAREDSWFRAVCKSALDVGLSENVVSTPKPNGFHDDYPYEKLLFHWGYTPFSDKPMLDQVLDQLLYPSWRIDEKFQGKFGKSIDLTRLTRHGQLLRFPQQQAHQPLNYFAILTCTALSMVDPFLTPKKSWSSGRTCYSLTGSHSKNDSWLATEVALPCRKLMKHHPEVTPPWKKGDRIEPAILVYPKNTNDHANHGKYHKNDADFKTIIY